MSRIALPLALIVALAACVPARKPEATPAPDACGASRVQEYQGAAADSRAREAVARDSGARTIRWIGPGDAVTMDYRPDRLNAELDAAGRIAVLRCG